MERKLEFSLLLNGINKRQKKYGTDVADIGEYRLRYQMPSL
jgi:hypothetical protein